MNKIVMLRYEIDALSAQLAAANARAEQARDKAFDEMLSLIMAYAVYTREALERATASALVSNMIAVTRSRMAHDLADVVLALRDKPAPAVTVQEAARVLLGLDENETRKSVYEACEKRIKVYVFDKVLRAIAAIKEPKP